MKKATERTFKMLEWQRNNQGWWEMLFTPGEMNLTKMKTAIDLLAEQRFYELIFAALTVHRHAPFMQGFERTMWLDEMLAHWNEENARAVVERVQGWLE